jgi:membrane dipeptidase
LTTAAPLPDGRPIWEQYWTEPGAGYELMSKAQYDSVSWLNWPMFTVGLVQRGFTDEEIRKIIGGNVIRVITETLEK